VDRTILFNGIRASVFREPESFLQFLMFSEWSSGDREDAVNEQVAKIRSGGDGVSGRGRYSYTGVRPSAADAGAAGRDQRPRVSARSSDDASIDFIPDADSPGTVVPRGPAAASRPSREISFDERRPRGRNEGERMPAGRSAEISITERFEGAREKEPLSLGRSVDIPLEERFGGAREKEQLSRGRSVEIPLEERFGGSREKEQLSRGGSVDIPLEDRFESARRDREKLSKGKSADIPYSERRGGNR
jgi:hypothetical protein